jgi:hypothetical protein
MEEQFDPIRPSDGKEFADGGIFFRELTMQELTAQHEFNDTFRISLTMRMGRDDALLLARRIEALVTETLMRDCRVYVGVVDHK